MTYNPFRIINGGKSETLEEIKALESAYNTDPTEEIAYNLLERCYGILEYEKDEESQNACLAITCRIADGNYQSPSIQQLLDDCFTAARILPYRSFLKEKNANISYVDSISKITLEGYYSTKSGTLLTSHQFDVLSKFQESRRIVVSAPTSFGKSRLLQEIILKNNYKRILVILPTIALINESYHRFSEDLRFRNHRIYNSVTPPTEEKFIFILTPEKVDLLTTLQSPPSFDFFTMDEVYKVADDPERGQVFNSVLYTYSQFVPDFYLIGPYFKSFSPSFLSKRNAKFLHYGIENVQKEIIDLPSHKHNSSVKIGNNEIKKAKGEKTNLKRVIGAIDGQTLVYTNRKSSAESKAKAIAELNRETKKTLELSKYIKELVHPNWSLISCLERGVAFHHGAIPRYIQSEIVECFNRSEIDTLVCTTTLTEGVNTTAKNVIVLSNFKGDKPLTGFDYKNIKGRAGRFLKHFTGRVINFVEMAESERDEIPLNYFDNQNLDSDDLLQVNDHDLDPSNLDRKKRVLEEILANKIDPALIRKNKYITVEKQLVLYKKLKESKHLRDSLYFATNLPQKATLGRIISICHELLFSNRDKENRNFNLFEIEKQLKYYIFLRPPLRQLIENQRGVHADTKIRNAFTFISHWLEFALPKYLTTFFNIYNVANETPINFGYLLTLIQYGFNKPHEIALKEAGIPDDIISKISNKFSSCSNLDEIRLKLKFEPSLLGNLSSFESEIAKRYL